MVNIHDVDHFLFRTYLQSFEIKRPDPEFEEPQEIASFKNGSTQKKHHKSTIEFTDEATVRTNPIKD